MTKKETIIIASLVNAALLSLIMLFAYEIEEPKQALAAKVQSQIAKEAKKSMTPMHAAPAPVLITKSSNPLDTGDRILQAKEILINEPVKEEAPVAVAPTAPKVESTAEEWYVVKVGDSPWKIAKAHKTTTDQILQLNHLNEEKARNLKPGDKIRIR